MFYPIPGNGCRSRAAVGLLQQEHVYQREICWWGFLLQTPHTHPVSARRTWGKPSLLPGTATHRLPRCYPEHKVPLHEHKVSAQTSLTNCCCNSPFLWIVLKVSVCLLSTVPLCLNVCKRIESLKHHWCPLVYSKRTSLCTAIFFGCTMCQYPTCIM